MKTAALAGVAWKLLLVAALGHARCAAWCNQGSTDAQSAPSPSHPLLDPSSDALSHRSAAVACCLEEELLPGRPPAVPAQTDPLAPAKLLLEAGRYREAEEALRAYLTQNKDSGRGHALLAYSLLRDNKPRESLDEYTRAAALEAPSAEMLERVGQDYVLLGDWEDAGNWTLRGVQLDPSNADAWYSLGRIRYTDQKFKDALSCFQQVLKLSPKNVKAENNLGLTYEAMNQTELAVAAYRQAIRWQNEGMAGEKSEQPLVNLGTVLLHRGERAEAEVMLTQAAAIAPRDPRILEQLGQLHLQTAAYVAAQRELAQACERDPGNSALHFLLGQAYRHLGQKAKAEAEFAASARLANAAKP